MRLCKEKYGLFDRMIYVLGESSYDAFLSFCHLLTCNCTVSMNTES